MEIDGIGRSCCNDINFPERYYGVHGALAMTTLGDTTNQWRAK